MKRSLRGYRLFLSFWALMMTAGAAWPLSQSSLPPKISIPWASSAGAAYIRSIPNTSQIGIQNCAASYPDGFPPLTFTPAAAGGCPPFGQDFNGLLKQITQWNQWQAISSGLPWDSSFSTSIGGYPKGAIVQSNVLLGRLWLSTTDNNTNNPDSTSGTATNWIVLPGLAQPGQMIANPGATPYPNTVLANGSTIGNASSNATNRANADTFWLFSYLWINCSPCALFNSSGGTISRGASAAADFSANDAIVVIDNRGTGLIGADSGTGRLTGVPVSSGGISSPGSAVGENLHTLTLTEIATGINSGATNAITVSGSAGVSVTTTLTDIVQATSFPTIGTGGGGFNFPLIPQNAGSTAVSSTGTVSMTSSGTNTINVTSNNTGGGAHNTVERSSIVFWDIAL